jgi:hypothetical protein
MISQHHSEPAEVLDVNNFLNGVEVELIRVEGALRVLQRSIWDVEQDLDPQKWGNENLAEIIGDRVRMLYDQIERYQAEHFANLHG